jgi:hypothetical protein
MPAAAARAAEAPAPVRPTDAHVAAVDALFLAARRASPADDAALDALRAPWRGAEVELVGDAPEIAERAPQFFARLEASVAPCRGVVFELGPSVGQMTRWIAAEESVARVFAADVDPAALGVLRAQSLPKTTVLDARTFDARTLPPIDTLVLCETIEHVTTRDELAFLARLAPALSRRTRYVISTPVGFLEDPTHVRGFTKTQFVEHLEGLYGPLETLDYRSGYSQVAVGRLERLGLPYRG